MFSCEFREISKNTFSKKHPLWLLLELSSLKKKKTKSKKTNQIFTQQLVKYLSSHLFQWLVSNIANGW